MLKHYTGCCDQSVVIRIIVEVIISYPDWPGLYSTCQLGQSIVPAPKASVTSFYYLSSVKQDPTPGLGLGVRSGVRTTSPVG